MRRITAVLILFFVLLVPIALMAQSAPGTSTAAVPRLIQVSGVYQPADGRPSAGVEVAIVSIYADADGGLPVWQERQSVVVDGTTGRFTLLLGASYPDGIPAEIFEAGQAQWMSVLFERPGEREPPRVRIASVPYALKASDAETLGGLPASAYLRVPGGDTGGAGHTPSTPTSADAAVNEPDVLPGTTNFLAKYVNGTNVGKSAVYETPTVLVPTGAVGIGTTAPSDVLHLRFTDPGGQITGLAVQNLANTSTAYSGMLFYDQNGALAQFQGFNNVTHEYRVNNIATGGSINLMLGSTSRLFVAPAGSIGIGTNNPQSKLHVRDANDISTSLVLETVSSGTSRLIVVSNYGNSGAGNYWPSFDSANTSSLLAPNLFVLRSTGGLLFSGSSAAEHLRITTAGNVGIGTNAPDPLGRLAVVAGGNAVSGRSTGGTGVGLVGYASAPAGFSRGVYGQADSSAGIAVHGYSPGGIGVTGNTLSGIGVNAEGAGSGSTALQIRNGAIKVNGASAPVFFVNVQTGAGGNTCAGGSAVTIDNPYTNDHADAILFVMPSASNQPIAHVSGTLTAVYQVNDVGNPPCPANRWFIQTNLGSDLPDGLRLNVMVIHP